MRTIILVLDSLGIGSWPDARGHGGAGPNTLIRVAEKCARGEADRGRSGRLRLPNFEKLGLGLACRLVSGILPAGFSAHPELIGLYAAARGASSGKDRVSRHWELAGVPVRTDWGYFSNPTDSFPSSLLERLMKRCGLPGYFGNCQASGARLIERYGEEHMRTGKPIFYTSEDSVFQIACHEDSFGLCNLYRLCEITREEVDEYNICRVIARPFVGDCAQSFVSTGNRYVLSAPPPADTLLKKVTDAGGDVTSVGGIADIYADVGITKRYEAAGLPDIWDATLNATWDARDNSIVMADFADPDRDGSRPDGVSEYASGLEFLDGQLPDLLGMLGEKDILVVTAERGDVIDGRGGEIREYVPLLVHGADIAPGGAGLRDTYADLGQSLAARFGLSPCADGVAFF